MCSVLVGLGQGGLLRCLGLEPSVSTALGTKMHPFAFGLSVCALRVWADCGFGAVPPTMNIKPPPNYFNPSKSKFGFSRCACVGSGSCKCVKASLDI